MEKQKKIKGSAVVSDEGLFVFTPYGTRDGENDGLKLAKVCRFGALWFGKKHFSFRLKISRENPPRLTDIVRDVISAYDEILKLKN